MRENGTSDEGGKDMSVHGEEEMNNMFWNLACISFSSYSHACFFLDRYVFILICHFVVVSCMITLSRLMFVTSKFITCLIGNFTSGMKIQSITYLLSGSTHTHTHILDFGPWRWSTLNMEFVNKWPSKMQGQWFFWSQARRI